MSAHHLVHLVIGVGLGLLVGVLPGLGGIVGLSLVLPFMFGMEPGAAVAMMVGMTSVTSTSDTFPSVLMGIPGSSASQATVLDGFPLSKNGQAARALSAAFSASLIGGLIGAVVLTGAIFIAKPLILAIGFGEQMMLVIFALTMVGVLSGDSPAKGLAACCFGLILGAVGESYTTATMRLGFDIFYLLDGLPLVAVALGMFALPEVVDLLRRRETISKSRSLGVGWWQGFKDTIHHRSIVLRCSVIGCLVGILPGLGGSVVDWIAYGHVVQFARDKSRFGQGDIRGVIAPESANNAKEGGALVPTMLFGIPGSGSMAILLGGLLIVGIEPGPRFVAETPDLAFLLVWSIGIANIIGAGTCILLAQPVAKLTTIRYALLAPFIIVIVFFAAYQATRDIGDLVTLLVLGTLGIYMKRFGWSRPALLIGFVLSTQLEMSIYQTYTAYGATFLQRPIVLVILALTLLSVYVAVRARRSTGTASSQGAPSAAGPDIPALPQILFAGTVMFMPLWAIYDSLGRPFSMALFPIVVGVVGLVPGFLVLYRLMTGHGDNAVFHDSEPGLLADADGTTKSTAFHLAWLFGLMGASMLIGFVFAVAAFMFLFIRTQARGSLVASAACTLAIITLLGTLGHFLSMSYPAGLLQDHVPMPWPFF